MKKLYFYLFLVVFIASVSFIIFDGILLFINLTALFFWFIYKYTELKKNYFLSISFTWSELFKLFEINEHQNCDVSDKYKHMRTMHDFGNVSFEYYISPKILSSFYHIYDQQNKNFLSTPNSDSDKVLILKENKTEKGSISFGLENNDISKIKTSKKICFWIRYDYENLNEWGKYIILLFDEKYFKIATETTVPYEAYMVDFVWKNEGVPFKKLDSEIKKIETDSFIISTSFNSINERASSKATYAISEYFKSK